MSAANSPLTTSGEPVCWNFKLLAQNNLGGFGGMGEGMSITIAKQGSYLLSELAGMRTNQIRDVRGRGLMVAVEFHPEVGGARRFCENLKDAGLLCKETHKNTLRLAPPLVITREQVDWALEIIERVLRNG